MRKFYLIPILMMAVGVVTCKQYQSLTPSRARQLQPSEVRSWHPEVTLQVAWVPYQEQRLVKTGKDEWKVVQNDATDKTSAVPVILVRHENSVDSVWLDMNIENALLGKLIKHSLMTTQPITRPFTTYFEEASCKTCHPSDVEVDFNR